MVVSPPSCDVTLVQEARDVDVVLLLRVLEFVGAEEAVNDALNHFGRVI